MVVGRCNPTCPPDDHHMGGSPLPQKAAHTVEPIMGAYIDKWR